MSHMVHLPFPPYNLAEIIKYVHAKKKADISAQLNLYTLYFRAIAN